MTKKRKTWTTVRPEICRLYADGMSLREVREHMLANGFDAAERTYRLKFKQWGVKRPRVFRRGSTPGPNESDGLADTASSRGGAQTVSEQVPNDPSRRLSARYGLDSDGYSPSPDETHVRPTIRDICSCRRHRLQHDLIEMVIPGRLDQNFLEDIHKCLVEDGVDNVLHATLRSYDYERSLPLIIEIARQYGTSLDVRDCHGSTALETAIQLGCSRAVRWLLEAGVSVDLVNSEGRTPLHLAILSFAGQYCGIFRLLLEHGANVDSCEALQHHAKGRTPFELALSFLESPTDTTAEHRHLVYEVVLELLSRSDSNEERCIDTLAALLEIRAKEGTAVESSSIETDRIVAKCYQCILVKVRRSMDVAWPANGCALDNCEECRSLLRYALFHAPDTLLCNAIAHRQCRDILSQIMEELRRPCEQRLPACKDDLADMMRELLKAGFSFPYNQNALSRVMLIPDGDLLVAILRMLLEAGITDIYRIDVHLSRPLHLRLPATIKFRAAELLLEHDTSLTYLGVSQDTQDSFIRTLSSYESPAYRDHLRHCVDGFCERDGLTFRGLSEILAAPCHCHKCTLFSAGESSLQGCVLHAVTKDVVERVQAGKQSTDPLREVIAALRIRVEWELPEIDMSTKFVLSLLDGCKIRSRGIASDCPVDYESEDETQ